MGLAAAAIAILILLVLTGRGFGPLGLGIRIAGLLLAVLAAAGAVAVGLRGGWMLSLVLVAVSGYFARAFGRGPAIGPRPPAASSSEMDVATARGVLGVGPGADRAEIEAAYRRLMQRAHPDHGGSSGLAAQINAARASLLKPERER